MMFPFSGQIEIPPISPEEVGGILSKFESALYSEKATSVSREGNKLLFRAGIFRLVPNWNVLLPVHRGEIEVIPGVCSIVKYKFSFLELFIVSFILSVFLGVFIWISSQSLVMVIGIVLPAWLFLFGVNVLIACDRLPRFVSKACKQ